MNNMVDVGGFSQYNSASFFPATIYALEMAQLMERTYAND
jgi:hypothetical protein